MYVVYMHIFPNNKYYIGITKQIVEKRWGKNGCGYKNQKLMWRAIQKYGWDNIDHIIVGDNMTKKEACELEIYLIQQYKSDDPKCGYNISAGGQLGLLGTKHPNFGKHLLDVTKERIRKSLEDKMKGERHPLSIIKIAEAVDIYNKLCDGVKRRVLADMYCVCDSVIDRIANKTHWTTKTKPELFERRLPILLLYQYTLDGKFVNRWNKIIDAVNTLGINYGSISSCCKGKLNKAGGYRWKWIYILDTGEEIDYDG